MLLYIVDFTSWQIGRNQIRRKWLEPFRAGSSWVDSEASLPISHPLWGHVQQKILKEKNLPILCEGTYNKKLIRKVDSSTNTELMFSNISGLAYCGCLALLKEKGSILSLKYAIHAFLWNSWYQKSEKCECELKVVSNICIVLWRPCRRARAQIEYRRWSYSDSHRSD